jgi:hypothetical protein
MERGSRKRSLSARSEKMERVGDRWKKNEGILFDRPKWKKKKVVIFNY